MAGYCGLIFLFLDKLSTRAGYVPLHSSEPLLQFPPLNAMILAQSTAQSINILPKTGPTGGYSTLSATGFILPLLVISSTLPWGGVGMTRQTIKHFVKLCMEAQGNGTTLLNVSGSYVLIGALTCRGGRLKL